jgi:hypothetical protein
MLALLLDRSGFDSWKGLIAGGLTISESVGRFSSVEPSEWRTMFTEAQQAHRFSSLREQIVSMERRHPPGYQAFLQDPSGKITITGLPRAFDRGEVRLDWSRPGGEWFRLLGSTPPVEIDARTLLGHRLEGVHYRHGGFDVQLGSGPVLMRGVERAWSCHEIVYHDLPSRVRVTLDGAPVSWMDQERRFEHDLDIQSTRGRVHLQGKGQLSMSGNALHVTIGR